MANVVKIEAKIHSSTHNKPNLRGHSPEEIFCSKGAFPPQEIGFLAKKPRSADRKKMKAIFFSLLYSYLFSSFFFLVRGVRRGSGPPDPDFDWEGGPLTHFDFFFCGKK